MWFEAKEDLPRNDGNVCRGQCRQDKKLSEIKRFARARVNSGLDLTWTGCNNISWDQA